jgi:hypothetical protein
VKKEKDTPKTVKPAIAPKTKKRNNAKSSKAKQDEPPVDDARQAHTRSTQKAPEDSTSNVASGSKAKATAKGKSAVGVKKKSNAGSGSATREMSASRAESDDEGAKTLY